jgi:predicted short-subunit dehydrogenase-like oxidoreductase (DUF2520 family)
MGASFALIGAGRVGNALAEALFQWGWKCAAVISHRPEPARQLALRVGAPIWGDKLNLLPENFSPRGVAHLFLCTPDDILSTIVNDLVQLPRQWDEVFVAHTSGIHSSLILKPLAERGAVAASLHPAMSFTGVEGEWQKLAGGWVALEGNEAAQKAGREVLTAFAAKYILLLPEQKILYHIACVLVSNYLVTLHAQAEMLLESVGGVTDGRALLQNLSRTVLENLKTQSGVEALTGPIARGDAGVIAAHLRLLAENYSQLLPVYRELGLATLALARARLDSEMDKKISTLLTN